MIKLGSASIDENGKIFGGKEGDQTGKEIKIHNFYDFPWNVYIECPDKAMAEAAASFMEQVCLDDSYGYDQSQRTTGYNAIVNNGNKVKGAKGEFDCSSLVSSCYRLAGLDISPNNSTRTLRKALMTKGFKIYTDDLHVHSDKFATRGGIYLAEGHHVEMALEDGIFAGMLVIGCSGEEVTALQSNFKKIGYTIAVDGEFGPKTEAVVKDFQQSKGLEADGIVGQDTMEALNAALEPKKPTVQEIAVDAALAAGIINNREHWLQVLKGEKPVNLDYLAQAFINSGK